MNATTGRQRAIAKALTALLPLAPYADTEKIRAGASAKHLKSTDLFSMERSRGGSGGESLPTSPHAPASQPALIRI